MEQDLSKILAQSESTDLSVLITAKEEAKRRVMDNPSAGNLSALHKANEMLKNFAPDTGTEPAAVDWSSFKETANRAEVLRFLRQAGYRVADRTFYRHCKQGQLRKNTNDVYTRILVKKYALTHLVGEDGRNEGSLEARKKEKEIERLDIHIAYNSWKMDMEQGKYIPRSDFEAEVAARAVVLNNGLTHLIQSAAADIIGLVNGDQTRSPELVAFLVAKKDDLLNDYASLEQYQVLFDMDGV